MWGVWGGVVPGARSFWERCKPPRDGGADPGQAAAGRGGGGGAAQAAPVPVPSSPHHLAGGCGAAKAPLGASVSPAFSVAEGNTRVPQPLLRPWACGVETHAQAHARR